MVYIMLVMASVYCTMLGYTGQWFSAVAVYSG